MNPWPFVFAAYAICIVGTGGLLLRSYLLMRRAEAGAEALTRR